jgi:hypothetical protein
MAYNPINLGPTNTVNSQAVVLPSDQVAIPVKIDQTTPGTTNKVDIGTNGTVAVTGVATSANQTNGTQQTKLTNGTITADIKTLGTQLVSADNGIIVNAVMHGLTTGGGGGYVDVKVNPSGSLVVDASGSTVGLSAGSAAIGSITNTAFGISGTLPAFTSTPTFNVGTISTIATESTLSTLNTKIPSNLTVTSTRLLVDGSGVTQPVSSSASTTGGALCGGDASSGRSTVTGAAGPIVVRNTTAQVYGWYFYNPNTTAAYVHFYNASTITGITPGTTDPYYMLTIPPVSGANAFGVGIAHSNGIVIGITSAKATATNTVLGVDYNIFYK